MLKCLVIVDDATHEAIAVMVEHGLGGEHLTHILDRICSQRGRPAVIRTDNGAEFCGRAMLTWAHRNGVALRLIEPGKANQNAYVESFNGRLRDDCLNEHWFTSLTHARSVIRDVATGIQRGETQKSPRRANARRVCPAVSRPKGRYNAREILDPAATQGGGRRSQRQKF
jgi:putative transposase